MVHFLQWGRRDETGAILDRTVSFAELKSSRFISSDPLTED